jgi:hypothetical protein
MNIYGWNDGSSCKRQVFQCNDANGFDNTIGKINIIPQDIEETLNLQHKYAINEKKKQKKTTNQQFQQQK